MAEVDSLEITLQSDISKVNAQLDALIKKLGVVAGGLDAIRNNEGLKQFSEQAKNISATMNNMSQSVRQSMKNSGVGDMTKAMNNLNRESKKAADNLAKQWGIKSKEAVEEVRKNFSDYISRDFLGNTGDAQESWNRLSDVIRSNAQVVDRSKESYAQLLEYVKATNEAAKSGKGSSIHLPFSTSEFKDSFNQMRAIAGGAFTTQLKDGSVDFESWIDQLNKTLGNVIPVGNTAADTFANFVNTLQMARDNTMSFSQATKSGATSEDELAHSIINAADGINQYIRAARDASKSAGQIAENAKPAMQAVSDGIDNATKNVNEAIGNFRNLNQASANALSPELTAKLEQWEQEERNAVNEAKNGLNEVAQKANQTGAEMAKAFTPKSAGTTGWKNKMASDLDYVRERIAVLDEKFKNAGKDFVFKGNGKQLQDEITKTENALDKLYDKQDRAIDLGQYRGKAFEGIIRDINALQNKLEILKNQQTEIRAPKADFSGITDGVNNAKKNMSLLGGVVDNIRKKLDAVIEAFRLKSTQTGENAQTQAFREEQAEIEALKNEYDSLNNKKTELSRSRGGGSKSDLSSMISILKRVGNEVSAVSKKFTKMISPISAARKAMDTLNLGGLMKNLTRVGTMLRTMLTRKALREVIDSIGSGFESLTHYSTEFGNNVAQLKSALATLGNSIAAAASPLINALTPALMVVIEWLTKAVNAINQFISALTGKSTWFKATKVVAGAGDAAKGAGKKAKQAAKDVMKSIRAFDELKVINLPDQNNDNGSGSGGGAGGVGFEEVPIDKNIADWAQKIKDMWDKADFTELGKELGKKLRDALNSIDWDKIKNTAFKVGKSLATLINGFVSVNGLAHSIGKTLAEAINTGIKGINAFFDYTDFLEIGRFIGNGFNSLVDYVDWNGLGHMFAQYFNDIFGLIGEAARTIEWDEFGQSLSDGLNKFISDFDWIGNGTDIGDLIKGLVTTIATFIENTNWNEFGAGIAKFINSLWSKINETIKSVDWAKIGKSIVDFIAGFLGNFNWGNVSASISALISALYNFMAGVMKAIKWRELPMKIIEGIASFLKGFDWKSVLSAMGKLLGAALRAEIETIGSIWDILKKAWGNISSYFDKYIQEAGGNIIAGLFKGILDAIANVGQWITDNIVDPFINAVKEGFKIGSPSKIMAELGGFIIEGLWVGIKDAWSSFAGFWSDKKDELVNKYNNVSATLKKKGTEMVSGLKEGVGKVWGGFSESWTEKKNSILNLYSRIKTEFLTKGQDIINGIKEGINGTFGTLKTLLTSKKNEAVSTFNDIKNKFLAKGKEIIEGIKSGITSKWGELKDTLTDKKKAIVDLFGKIKDSFVTVGKDILSGIESGFNSAWATFKTFIDGKISALVGWFNASDFVDAGKNIVKGILDGLKKSWDSVTGWLGTKITELKKMFGIGGGGGKDEKSKTPPGGKRGGYVSDIIKGYAAGGYTPYSYTLFMAGENGVPEILGTVGGKNAVAGGAEITGIREAVNANGATEAQLLSAAVNLLSVIADKDFGITQNEIGRAAQLFNRDHQKRTGRPAF